MHHGTCHWWQCKQYKWALDSVIYRNSQTSTKAMMTQFIMNINCTHAHQFTTAHVSTLPLLQKKNSNILTMSHAHTLQLQHILCLIKQYNTAIISCVNTTDNAVALTAIRRDEMMRSYKSYWVLDPTESWVSVHCQLSVSHNQQ